MATEAERRLVFVDVQRSGANPQTLLLALGDFAQEFDNDVYILTYADAMALVSALLPFLEANQGG